MISKHLIIILFLLSTVIFAQKNYDIYIGLDISPLKNIVGQHEVLVEYRSKKSKWINPYIRAGYANRILQGGCLKDDYVEDKKGNGWFVKVGNDFMLLKRFAVSPILIINNYQASGLYKGDSIPRVVEIKNQTTFYTGLSLRSFLVDKPKWGISMCLTGVRAIQKEPFLGSGCNEPKIGAGVELLPDIAYWSLQTLIYWKF